MKFLLITHYWKNSLGGGVRVYSENLVNKLKKLRVSVARATLVHPGNPCGSIHRTGSGEWRVVVDGL